MQKVSNPGGASRGSKVSIPLIRPSVGEEELDEVRKVIESGWLANGPKVKEFEKKIAAFVGAKYVVATSSCTTALSLAIESLRIKRGSEILVPDFTFPATGNVVVRADCKPVLVDVRPEIFSIRVPEARAAVGKRTSAIIPVHPFGHPFEVDELYELADERGLEVIEDAATAIGTMYKKGRIGGSRRAVCFSFHPRKLLTTAEGGCLATDDQDVYERALSMRNHGQSYDSKGKVTFRHNGLNYRLSDVHAAIGIAQLEKIDSIIATRRRQARVYAELIDSGRLDAVPPVEMEWAYHTYQSYVILLGRSFSRDRCIKRLGEEFMIETQVGTYALADQPAFRSAKAHGTLRTSKRVSSGSLTLPMYEGLTEEQQEYIVSSLGRVAGG